MWNFMKAWKGRKIPCQGAKSDQLWHEVDQEPQEPHEVELSRRVSYAVRLLRECGEAKNLCTADSKMKTFDGDWDRGQVFFRRDGSERPIRILQRSRATDLMEICAEPLVKSLLGQELAEFRLPERLGEINDPPRRQELSDDMRAEFDARVIFFQEWCVAGGAEQLFDGYVVHVSPPAGAWQRCAIAVHESLAPSTVSPPSFHTRTMSLDLQLPVWGRVRLIANHQLSRIVRCECAETIAQLRECLITMPIDCHAMASVDAQYGLGIGDGETVGQYSATKMTWRGGMLFDLMTEFDLVATRTFPRGQWGQAACYCDNRKGPCQIDFMLCHRDWLTPVTCQAIPTISEPEQALEDANLMGRPPRKPVAWQLEGAYLFNATVCSTLQVPYFPTAMDGLTEGDLGHLHGRLGAGATTWEAPGGRLIQVITDSTCVQGLLAEVFQPRENAHLAILAVHLWERAALNFDLHMRWVKGHSGNIGNEKADFWAKRGADRRFNTAHWRRPCPAHDWGAEEYRQRVSERKLAATRARKRRCSDISREDGGDTFAQLFYPQPRLAAACSRQGTPSISALATAISAGAAVAGRASRGGRRGHPRGDPELLRLKRLEQLRAQETDLRVRHLLGPAVATAKRALRGRCNAVHLGRSCARGRADRPRRSGKPVYELKADDGQCASAVQARCELTRAFYADLFADPTSDQALPAWVRSQWAAEHRQAEVPLPLPVLKTVIGQLKSRKSCAESDMIVAEMVQGLQDDALEKILAAFRLRLCNHVSEYFDQAWTGHVVQLIREKPEAQKVAEIRPIALVSVLLKILSMMVLEQFLD
ncbi:unnamed protein product [Prorocentrum cordatum]|uniref:RNase H type-1 domain-containing protein n=1 Tax=Prorocentrum cordatum TaxID=2364126 RepID=A0ABN9TT90_9DINO|nr:unnamed protein product [Polarella glacialis]